MERLVEQPQARIIPFFSDLAGVRPETFGYESGAMVVVLHHSASIRYPAPRLFLLADALPSGGTNSGNCVKVTTGTGYSFDWWWVSSDRSSRRQHVAWWGAAGVGETHDDLAAFVAARDWLRQIITDQTEAYAGATGGELILDGGTYFLSDTLQLRSGENVIGLGREVTKLLRDGDYDAIELTEAGSATHYCTIRGVGFKNLADNVTYTDAAFRAAVSANCVTISDFSIINGSYGIVLHSTNGCRITDGNLCCRVNGIRLNQNSTVENKSVHLENIIHTGRTGPYAPTGYGIHAIAARGASLVNVRAQSAFGGFLFDACSEVTLLNCSSDSCYDHAAKLDNYCSDFSFVSCWLRNDPANSGTNAVVQISAASFSLQFVSVGFSNAQPTTPAIYAIDGDGALSKQVTIMGCTRTGAFDSLPYGAHSDRYVAFNDSSTSAQLRFAFRSDMAPMAFAPQTQGSQTTVANGLNFVGDNTNQLGQLEAYVGAAQDKWSVAGDREAVISSTSGTVHVYALTGSVVRLTGSLSGNLTINLNAALSSASSSVPSAGRRLAVYFQGTLNGYTCQITGANVTKTFTAAGQGYEYTYSSATSQWMFDAALGGSGGGSVTSVALSVPSIFTVSGSPVTSSGTLSFSVDSQSANYFWAAPDGSAGFPVFRAIASADIPTLAISKVSGLQTELDKVPTALGFSSGTLSITRATGNLTVSLDGRYVQASSASVAPELVINDTSSGTNYPILKLADSSQGTDEKNSFFRQSGSAVSLGFASDAWATKRNAFNATRSGVEVTGIGISTTSTAGGTAGDVTIGAARDVQLQPAVGSSVYIWRTAAVQAAAASGSGVYFPVWESSPSGAPVALKYQGASDFRTSIGVGSGDSVTLTAITLSGRVNLPSLGSAPSSPVAGACYWDDAFSKLWVYHGGSSSWKSVTLT